MNFRIRLFRTDDCEAVSKLITRCLREVNSRDYSDEVIRKTIEHFSPDNLLSWFEGMDTFVAEGDGVIVGTGSIEGNRINSVFVSPDRQSQGIGRELMDYLEQMVCSRGFADVVLRSSLTALDFYDKLGYLKVGETFREAGGQMIEMKKDMRMTK